MLPLVSCILAIGASSLLVYILRFDTAVAMLFLSFVLMYASVAHDGVQYWRTYTRLSYVGIYTIDIKSSNQQPLHSLDSTQCGRGLGQCGGSGSWPRYSIHTPHARTSFRDGPGNPQGY